MATALEVDTRTGAYTQSISTDVQLGCKKKAKKKKDQVASEDMSLLNVKCAEVTGIFYGSKE